MPRKRYLLDVSDNELDTIIMALEMDEDPMDTNSRAIDRGLANSLKVLRKEG